MNAEQLRDYAKHVYKEHFKPNQCEDEWYHPEGYQINIFKWSDDGPAVANIYVRIGAEGFGAIDDFILED